MIRKRIRFIHTSQIRELQALMMPGWKFDAANIISYGDISTQEYFKLTFFINVTVWITIELHNCNNVFRHDIQ